MRHAITVADLRTLLSELRDDDVLVPNAVGNLEILREGQYAGFVDLLDGVPAVEMSAEDSQP